MCSVQLTLMAGDTLIKTLPGKTTEIFTSNVRHNNISLYQSFFCKKKCNRLENKLPLIILLFTKPNSLKFYIFYMTYFLNLRKKPKTIVLTQRNQEMPETCMHIFCFKNLQKKPTLTIKHFSAFCIIILFV